MYQIWIYQNGWKLLTTTPDFDFAWRRADSMIEQNIRSFFTDDHENLKHAFEMYSEISRYTTDSGREVTFPAI